jgi:hypothetical protein
MTKAVHHALGDEDVAGCGQVFDQGFINRAA